MNMSYEVELTKIKGIGKKTAEDIVKVYPTKDKLVEAVNSGMHLPFENDVSAALKKAFSKPKTEVKDGIMLRSLVGECVFSRSRNPHFRVTIGDAPVLVEKRVADFLLNDGTGRVTKA